MSGEVDFSELTALTQDIEKATRADMKEVRKAMIRTTIALKKDWKSRAARTGLRNYAASIDDTVKTFSAFGGAVVEVEIGPNLSRRRSGAAFGFVEDGGSGVRSAPQHAGRDALKAAEPDFIRGLEAALGQTLGEALS